MIKISITIELEADDAAALTQQFAALAGSLPQPMPTEPTVAAGTKVAIETADGNHNRRPVPVMPFEAFDELCRKEMKRLSLDKRLPGRKLWDEQRDRRLPTLASVQARYKCATLEELAKELGLESPLYKEK